MAQDASQLGWRSAGRQQVEDSYGALTVIIGDDEEFAKTMTKLFLARGDALGEMFRADLAKCFAMV